MAGHLAPGGKLHAIILAPQVEEELQELLMDANRGVLALPPARADRLMREIKAVAASAQQRTEASIVLLTAPGCRPHVARLIQRTSPDLPVLSYAEISDEVSLQVLGSVKEEKEPSEEVLHAG